MALTAWWQDDINSVVARWRQLLRGRLRKTTGSRNTGHSKHKFKQHSQTKREIHRGTQQVHRAADNFLLTVQQHNPHNIQKFTVNRNQQSSVIVILVQNPVLSLTDPIPVLSLTGPNPKSRKVKISELTGLMRGRQRQQSGQNSGQAGCQITNRQDTAGKSMHGSI